MPSRRAVAIYRHLPLDRLIVVDGKVLKGIDGDDDIANVGLTKTKKGNKHNVSKSYTDGRTSALARA